MDLNIKSQRFLVSGASSGFGKSIAESLLAEGASIIAVARTKEKLDSLKSAYPSQVEILAADITSDRTIDDILRLTSGSPLQGMLVNAGGPPAKTVMETTIADWDDAYKNILRWKIALTKAIVPSMIQAGYGRILFIESASVKQPMENLVLSNSMRLAAVGFVKTLSQETARTGVTLNILAPGSHDTAAIDRIYQKKSEQTGVDKDIVRQKAIEQIPVGVLGEAADFASLATWLLSPVSRYITGQTISVDGGSVKMAFG